MNRWLSQSAGVVALLLLGSLAFVHLLAIPAFEDEGTQLRWIWQIIENGHWLQPLGMGKPLEAWPMVPLLRAGLPPLFTIRAVHVLAGLLGVALLYRLGLELTGRWTAFTAAALFALCPYVIYLQRLALSEILLCTAGIGVLLAGVAFMRAPSNARAQALAAALLLAALCKLPVGFVFLLAVPMALPLMPAAQRRRMLQRDVAAKLLAAHAPAVLLALGVAAVALVRMRQHAAPGFGLSELFGIGLGGYQDIAAALGVPGVNLLDELTTQLSWPVTVIAILGLACSAMLNDWRQRWLIVVGLVPLLGIGLIAHFWYPRYLLFTLPPLILSAVAGWRTLALRAGAVGRSLEIAVLLITVFFMGRQSVLLILNPIAANWSPIDRFQYFEGWSSGYGYPEAAAFVLAAADAPAQIFSLDGHSAYQLRSYLPPSWAARVRPINSTLDGEILDSPAERLRNLLEHAPAWIVSSDQLLLGYLDSAFGRLNPRPFALRRVTSFDKPGSRAQLSIYLVTPL